MGPLADVLASAHWQFDRDGLSHAMQAWTPVDDEAANLDSYVAAVCEHYAAALEALGEMDNVEREMASHVATILRKPDPVDISVHITTTVLGDATYRQFRTRFTRLMRFMVTESCATLESLMYEVATIFRLRRQNGAVPEVGAWVGFYTEAYAKSLRESGEGILADLDRFLSSQHLDPGCVFLDDVRRKSFHRSLVPVFELIALHDADDPTPSPPMFRFLLEPRSYKQLIPELLSGLHSVLNTVNGTYEHSARAVRGAESSH